MEAVYKEKSTNVLIDMKLKKLPQLLVTDAVLVMITKSHISCPANTEWCGFIVLKKLAGSLNSLEDIEQLMFEVKGMTPFNTGDASFTEAKVSDHISGLMDEYPELLDDSLNNRVGLIHTHHSMSTFFSGEDNDELKMNAPDHLYYISLIVNYAGRYTARICITSRKNDYTINNENDTEVSFLVNTDKVIFYSEMQISITKDTITDKFSMLNEEAKKRIANKQLALSYKSSPYMEKGFNFNSFIVQMLEHALSTKTSPLDLFKNRPAIEEYLHISFMYKNLNIPKVTCRILNSKGLFNKDAIKKSIKFCNNNAHMISNEFFTKIEQLVKIEAVSKEGSHIAEFLLIVFNDLEINPDEKLLEQYSDLEEFTM